MNSCSAGEGERREEEPLIMPFTASCECFEVNIKKRISNERREKGEERERNGWREDRQ